MAHRCECLCSASQLWLPHPALCIVPPECFQGLHVWSGAMGSKSSKLRIVVDHDTKAALEQAADDMKQYYDQSHQSAPEYKVGDKVWLSLQNYSSDRPMKKLDHKWASPFTVTKVISPAAIKLHLSAWEKNIHPVISVSIVHPYIPDEI